ncbi:MAG: class I tRNA ligase family protein, partial [Clostridia bacterium]
VKMKQLSQPAIEVVKNGEIKFIPQYYEKTYFHWMENIKDWCVSRQLWWGHRIPVYYCSDCNEIMCLEDAPKVCSKCGSVNIYQDEDVLDTWFSSALWPMSTLGYPLKTEDYEFFFPTNVLVTAYDIIPFWVSRMIYSALYNVNQKPFTDVLIHGIIRDAEGRKMSKSLGNGIDPLKLIDEVGADTLRFSLLNGISNGTDIKFSEEKTIANRNFMNKVWNASRFVLMNAEDKILKDLSECDLSLADKWILNGCNELTKLVTANIETYDLGLASSKLYDFIWSEFCDWYIEFSKPILYGVDEDKRISNISVLVYVLDKLLKLLHPFTPFITEEIYQAIPMHNESIMLESYPIYDEKLHYEAEAELMDNIKDMISRIRNTRAEMDVAPAKRIRIFVKPNGNKENIIKAQVYIEKLAGLEKMEIVDTIITEGMVAIMCKACEVYIPLGDMVDYEKEKIRLQKELEVTESEILRAKNKLVNVGFLSKAPQKLVDEEKKKLENHEDIKRKLIAHIESLN